MKQWAFATSPHGLGLSAEAFWCLTIPQYEALKEVWAAEQAQFHNAHFVSKTPWIAADFMWPGSREQRIRQALIDEAEVIAANRKLAAMQPGVEYEGLPEWVKYGRKVRGGDGGRCNRQSQRSNQR